MMASETSIFSWDYTPWLRRFVSNTAINGGTLGRFIAEESQRAYGTSFYVYANTGLRDYCVNVVNFAVIDMAKLPTLTNAYDELFGVAIRRGYSEGNFYANFDRIAKDTNNSTGAEHYENLYIDLGRIAEKTQYFLPEARTLLTRVPHRRPRATQSDYWFRPTKLILIHLKNEYLVRAKNLRRLNQGGAFFVPIMLKKS